MSKIFTPAKYLFLIFTMLFLIPQGVNYAHNVLPEDHNHRPHFVNENAVEGTNSIQNVYVSENTPNHIIGSIKAVDEDEDDTLTYSLKSEYMYYSLTPDHPQYAQFPERLNYNEFYSVNSKTGEVSIGSSGLDYEAFPYTYHPTHIYQPVPIMVEDGNGGSALFWYLVYIKDENDNAPTFSADSRTLTVNENEPLDATVGTVSANDADFFAGDHTYSIETENVPFTIISSKRSGIIKTTSVLDYETTNSYTIKVKVDDGFGTDSISVIININNDMSDDPSINSNPLFTDGANTTRSIVENTPAGMNIGSAISATDSDNSDTLTFYLSGTDARSFNIVSTTGQLQTSAALDYETKNAYEVTITVSDGNGGTDSIAVTINITNDTSDDLAIQQQSEVTTPQNTDTQIPHTVQDDDFQQPKSEVDTELEPNYTIIPFDYEKESVGKIVFSEFMFADLGTYPQWIELYNTTDQDIDLNGWKIVGRYLDNSGTINILNSQIISKSFIINAKETGLIVSFETLNTRERISNGLHEITYPLASKHLNLWNHEGLVLELHDSQGNPIDRIGNLNEKNEVVWEIPTTVRENRISLIRRIKSIQTQEYNFSFGIKEFGWFSTDKVRLLSENGNQRFYGRHTDLGTPGHRTESGDVLPVTLSSFKAQRDNNRQIILRWVTESEVNNAGFNILRSETKQGRYEKINPKLIQGGGTTGKRNSYMWTDTTTKPNIVYYYRLEEISYAGLRSQLNSVRTYGHMSASKMYITQWVNLKKRN
ncbi:cadherin domain-containing protein [Candidatus Poribacteria bacterium]|nr:cadherin domain-containing protein [Candidatus Poribacteria bacterium]